MTIEETNSIIDKIKIYRPTFGGQLDKSIKNNLKLEWFKVLEKYDYEQVNSELDKFLCFEENDNKYPTAYSLIRGLKPMEEYLRVSMYRINCSICKKFVDHFEYDKHFDKCSSIDYICRLRKKCLGKETSKKELWELDDLKFQMKYWELCESLCDNLNLSEMESKALKNAVLTHYGYELEDTAIEEIKEVIKKI